MNALTPTSEFSPVVEMVVNSLESEHSKRAYRAALADFLSWWDGRGRPVLSKMVVQDYKSELKERGLSASAVNVKLSAVRKLAAEAADNGLLAGEIANGISRVKGAKAAGVRAGNWLTKQQAEGLLNSVSLDTLKGIRDRAILAVLVGAGLRRSEAAALTFDQIQQREGRWAIVDLVGKGGRVRSVPIPAWTKAAIDRWAVAAGVNSGRVFRGVYRFGKSLDEKSEGITSQIVYTVVRDSLDRAGLPGAAHDLRRTWAKLAHKGGAALDQIQLSLGHASIKTTERYINASQDWDTAPCDVLGLNVSGD